MSRGKNIRIYVAPDGVRHAEIWGWTGQAVAVARANIEALKDWKAQLSRPGVYVLLGSDESAPLAYIGESDDILARLKAHLVQKEFWNELIVFTSKDDHLTKAHVEYLEHRLVALAKEANRFELDNGNVPAAPSLPRGDQDGLDEYIDNLRVLLLVLGPRLLEPLQTSANSGAAQPTILADPYDFKMAMKGVSAQGRRTPDGFLVFKGSGASPDVAPALPAGYASLRLSLINQKKIVPDAGDTSRLVFAEDVLFKSPTAAACVVAASSRNGRDAWMLADGKTLAEVEDAEMDAVT